MKKYFYTAMALVALVGCNKDDVQTPEIDDSVQSIEISIVNARSATRTVEGGITPKAEVLACADIDDLVFLLAKADGTVIAHKNVSDGNISGSIVTFHTVSKDVAKVGVIANYNGANTLNTLDAAEVAWKDEDAMIDNPYRNITTAEDGSATTTTSYGVVAYGKGDLKPSGSCDHNGVLYAKKTASVTVAPYMARIEVEHIGFLDDFNALDYKKIGIKSLALDGGKVKDADGKSTLAPYVHTLGNFHHNTDWNTAKYVLSATHDHGNNTNQVEPETDDHVWSWNILPQEVSNLTTYMYLNYPNHTSVVHDRRVIIDEYNKVVTDDSGASTTQKIETFDSGNIYRFSIDFKNENLEKESNNAYICVECTVSIAEWVINDIDVDFATGGN